MRLSKTEECLLLDYHLQRGVYMDIVKNQLEIHHITIPIEEAMSRIAASVFSNTTTKEWNNYIKSRDVLRSIFLRRKYDVWNFFATKEAMESRYPDGAPEIVNELNWFHPWGKPNLKLDSKVIGNLLSSDILGLYNAFRQSVVFTPEHVIPKFRNNADFVIWFW